MKEHRGFWHMRVGSLLLMALLVLGSGQARGEGRGSYAGPERETLMKELGLTAEQVKAFQAVGDKCDLNRDKIIAEIRSKENDLEKALSAATPDEGKVKGLVAAITSAHDQLFQTVKTQRQEEMALLTPIQQGKFILALKKWHEGMKEPPGK